VDAAMNTKDGSSAQEGPDVLEFENPLLFKEKILNYRMGALLSLDNILDMALDWFPKSRPSTKDGSQSTFSPLNAEYIEQDDEDKKHLLKEIMQIAFSNNVVSEREIQQKLIVGQSTVNRWRNGETLPPKIKQVMLLELLHEKTQELIKETEAKKKDIVDERRSQNK